MLLQGVATLGDPRPPRHRVPSHSLARESGNPACVVGYLEPGLSPSQLCVGSNKSSKGVQLDCTSSLPVDLTVFGLLLTHCYPDLLRSVETHLAFHCSVRLASLLRHTCNCAFCVVVSGLLLRESAPEVPLTGARTPETDEMWAR